MALPRIGSDELLHIETDKVSLIFKGKIGHPKIKGKVEDQKAKLVITCSDIFQGTVDDSSIIENIRQNKKTYASTVTTIPMFYEQSNYHLTIVAHNDSIIEFQHDNYNIRQAVSVTGRDNKILTGIINFGNNIGYSDFVVLVNKKEYLRVKVEVFPSKISYKEDYDEKITERAERRFDLELKREIY